MLSHLAQISTCAEKNHELLQAIVHNSLHMFENTEYGQRVRLDLGLSDAGPRTSRCQIRS